MDSLLEQQLDSILAELGRFQISTISHGRTDLLCHLKGTAEILHRWACPLDLVKAGLCHSIYGTESFLKQPATLENRKFVQKLIGANAERTAYYFGAHQKESLWKNLCRAKKFSIFDRFSETDIALSRSDLHDLITLTLANWLEQRPRAGKEHQYLRKKEFLCAKSHLPAIAYDEFLQSYALDPVYKEKVLAYITRQKPEGWELLVFEHRDFPDAGVQVPAGTVGEGESIAAALLREISEETGLEFKDTGNSLGQFIWFREDRNELHQRNVFCLSLDANASDGWVHIVKSHDEDSGMAFQYYWLPLSDAREKLAGDQGAYLGEVKLEQEKAKESEGPITSSSGDGGGGEGTGNIGVLKL